MQNLPKSVLVNLLRFHRDRRLDHDKTEFSQVPKEDADHAERQINVGGDVHHRRGPLGKL
jgi:hypothetical protein